MKQSKIFLKSFFISLLIAFCIFVLIIGIGMSYEAIKLVRFGEYAKSFEITKDGIKILDFIIKL